MHALEYRVEIRSQAQVRVGWYIERSRSIPCSPDIQPPRPWRLAFPPTKDAFSCVVSDLRPYTLYQVGWELHPYRPSSASSLHTSSPLHNALACRCALLGGLLLPQLTALKLSFSCGELGLCRILGSLCDDGCLAAPTPCHRRMRLPIYEWLTSVRTSSPWHGILRLSQTDRSLPTSKPSTTCAGSTP
jgi:hypothetical protein